MNAPYLLFPIGIFTLSLYLFTLLLCRMGVMEIKTQRKIWNMLLLFTFLITATLGLMLAVQVNYRLKMPFLDEILTIHVDFGIAMSLIAVFHFLWHGNYYLNILGKRKTGEEKNNLTVRSEIMPENTVQYALKGLSMAYGQVFVLGFTSTLVQIVMMREFMLVFGGNELVIGVILANWMVLTGLGAFAGKSAKRIRNKNYFSRTAMIMLGWIPPVVFFLIEFFRNQIFRPGIEVGFFQIIVSTIAFMAPFCLLSGFLFTYLAGIVSHHITKIPVEKAYAVEAAGSLWAGILTSFVLFFFLSNFQVLILLPVCTSVLLLFPIKKVGTETVNIIIVIATLTIVSVLFFLKADYWLKTAFFAHQEVLSFNDTPYGNLAVTRSADQLNIFDNGKLLFSTDNQIGNEEAVHFAMAQHPDPRLILLVSGGISGITNEILKYDVERIDYIEINPSIFAIGKAYTNALDDSCIRPIRQDARRFIQKTKNHYDLVLINLPEPSTAQLNRYYTVEFLHQIRNLLHENGIITLNMPSTANYLSDEAIQLNSVIYNTCKKVFKNVLIIPGERNYYLLSDRVLTTNVTQLIENKNIKNDYLNSYYIDTLSLQERSDYLMENLNLNTLINNDFKPVSYFYYLGFWLRQFNLSQNVLWAILAGLTVILLFAGILFQPVTSALMITGFSASSLEIILLLALQIISGYIYQVMGICIAVFMGGLATGVLTRILIFHRVTFMQFTLIQLIIGVMAILIPILLVTNFMQWSSVLTLCVILLLLFIISFSTGVIFSMAVHLRKSSLIDTVAVLYSADLIGSAMGAFLTSVFLIPLLGVISTSYLVGGLILVYALNLILRRKQVA